MFGKLKEKIETEREEKELVFDKISMALAKMKNDHEGLFALECETLLELEDLERKMKEDSACIGQLEIEILKEYFAAIIGNLKELESIYNCLIPFSIGESFKVSNYLPESFEEFKWKTTRRYNVNSVEEEEFWEFISSGEANLDIGALTADMRKAIFTVFGNQARQFLDFIKRKPKQ